MSYIKSKTEERVELRILNYINSFFVLAALVVLTTVGEGTEIQGDPVVVNGISVPSDFPWVDITINQNPDTGYIFLNNWGGQPYNMILDNNGFPVWYRRTPDRRRDFKVQPHNRLSMLVRNGGEAFIVMDSTYTIIDTLRAGAGYTTDEHEFQMLPDGHYLMIGHKEETVDMTQYLAGANPHATVYETAIQEFNEKGELIFLWRAWDHYDIRDVELENLYGGYIRFPHMNAIDIDDDGNILVSCRHLSEITKIKRNTGEIIWRLGGAHNQFTFVNDELNGFRNQHDIRSLGNGHYTLFDNGNLHNPPVSRAVEYVLDTLNMTATLVWEFRDTPDKYTSWMGNVQRLPNGNTLINWADGSLPKLTEVTPDGKKAFEMNFRDYIHTYRVYRFPWKGIAKAPYLVVESGSDRVTLLFNKFGDNELDFYRIYGGKNPSPTQVIAETDSPYIHLKDLDNATTYFFRVTGVNRDGVESDYSNEESVMTRFVEPGMNMLFNGDFSSGSDYWQLNIGGSAGATGSVVGGFYFFDINTAGTEIWDVQLYQNGIELRNGQTYVFEFDCWSPSVKYFDAKVEKNASPWTNFGRIGTSYSENINKHYRYEFVMEDPTEHDARVVFNCGNSAVDLYIDNVSLCLKNTDSAEPDESLISDFRLCGNYPNPFNPITVIPYVLPTACDIVISIYDIKGNLVQQFRENDRSPGKHQLTVMADELSSGIYFYCLEAFGRDPLIPDFRKVRKMVVIK